MSTWEKWLAAVQPVLFAWAAVLAMATEIVTTPAAMVRPLVVGMAIALGAFGLFLGVTRSWALAALITSGLVLFNARQPAIGLAMIVIACWWLLVVYLRHRSGRPSPRPTVPRFAARASGIFSIVLVSVTAWGLVVDASTGEPQFAWASYPAVGSGGPNVYVLLADGYPRADTLSETFAIDNRPFLTELERMGFVVSDGARANYSKTWLTLASMLNGTYVDRMLAGQPVPPDGSKQIRWLGTMINRAAILDAFRERGYTIRSLPSPFTSTTLSTADELVDVGGMTELEVRLISASTLALMVRDPVLDFLRSGQRDMVIRSLEATAAMAERPEGPQLVLTHLHSPHTPFVLHPEGTEAADAPACQPVHCPFWNATIQELELGFDEYQVGLTLQIEELNRLLVAAIGQIVEADPSAIVVLMSDHGTRYSLDDPDEHFKILLATRTPDGDTLMVDDDSPVNILRRVLARLGEGVGPLDYERWNSDWVRILDMERAE